MGIVGDWDVNIKTPIGSLAVVYTFTPTDHGVVGSATPRSEVVPLQNIWIEDERVTWHQSVTKPIRLNLDLDVTVSGDTLTGHSKAGRLPRSAVTGSRRT